MSNNEPKSIIERFKEFKLPQNFDGIVERQQLTTVPVRRPSKQTYFRVHGDSNMRIDTGLIRFEEDGNWYLVAPELRDFLGMGLSCVKLVTCITLDSHIMLWPIKLPSPDGKTNRWQETAMAAADMATKAWIRLDTDMSLGAYKTFKAEGALDEPNWPEESFEELLELAFSNRFIDTINHPVAKKLRGVR